MNPDLNIETSAPIPTPDRGNPRRIGGALFARWKPAAVFMAAIAAVFFLPLRDLFRFTRSSELYSFIPLVPFIAAYLVWTIRNREIPAAKTTTPRSARGLAAGLAAGGLLAAALHVAGLFTSAMTEPNDRLFLPMLAFVLLTWSGAVFMLGIQTTRAILFPLGYMLFIVPLPTFARQAVETVLQHGSAQTTFVLLKLAGTPIWHQGTVFQLPNITLDVAPECSGIRSTLVLLMTGLIAGFLFLRKASSRVVLATAVIGLGILRNAVRIFTLAQLCVSQGPHMIESDLHRRGGPLFFALSLIPLVFLIWILRRYETRTMKSASDTVC